MSYESYFDLSFVLLKVSISTVRFQLLYHMVKILLMYEHEFWLMLLD